VSESKQTIDERFTDFADVISHGMGKWWVTAISVVLILLWLASGPFFHWSDTWQLIVNTPTTVVELWIGLLLAAATNRVERRHELLLREIKSHTRADEATTKRDAEVNRKSESEIAALREDIKAIKEAVLK
jgi:low affinity Fe/Cu permease